MKSVARVHLDGPLATLVLDDPGRRNLLGTEMFDAIEHGLEEAASSAVIRIRAEGPSFCSGFDLRASAQDTDAARRVRRPARSNHQETSAQFRSCPCRNSGASACWWLRTRERVRYRYCLHISNLWISGSSHRRLAGGLDANSA